MNSQNLTIYDFVVDIVPGALAILVFLSLLPIDVVAGLDIADITVGSSILVIVLGYFIGHLIQAVASPIDNWVYFLRRDEYPFEKTLQEASSDSVEERFSDNVDAFFELETEEPDNLTGIERFTLTQSYLWNNNIGRAQRFQILYSFLRSMWVLSVLGALLHLLGLIAMYGWGYALMWTPLQSGLIIAALSLAGIGSYLRRIQYHEMMAGALIFDFYANVLSQE